VVVGDMPPDLAFRAPRGVARGRNPAGLAHSAVDRAKSRRVHAILATSALQALG
jgi:hypothetical protein